MAESQSRYGIISDLTKQKLDIIGHKLKLQDEVKMAEQDASDRKKGMTADIENIKREFENQKRDIKEQVRRTERKAKNLKDRLKDKEKNLEAKEKAIDLALQRIEEISKTTPT